jgi:hypothetical protein
MTNITHNKGHTPVIHDVSRSWHKSDTYNVWQISRIIKARPVMYDESHLAYGFCHVRFLVH